MIDLRGNLWVGGFGEGLLQFQVTYKEGNISIQKIEYLESIAQNPIPLQAVRALAEDKQGNIIVGTRYNGIFYLRMKNNRVIRTLTIIIVRTD